MRKAGRKYVEAKNLVDSTKLYSVSEAVELVKKTTTTKFDSTIDFVIKLNVDPKKADQQLRGSLVLPNGTGKTKRVLVLAKGAMADAAKAAGATFVGADDMIEKIQNENWFDYDVIVATPDMMPALGKIGRVLGPKGLMPNPKTGTVTTDPAKAVNDINKGMESFKTDSYGNVHGIIGKASFTEKALEENLRYAINTILKLKPSTVKGKFVKSMSISSTMGPSVKLDQNSFDI